MDYVAVEDAVNMPGLRLALTRGSAGPWGLAARALFDCKGIPFVPVAQEVGLPNEALKAWTGQTSAPVAMYENERPRAHWSEQLMLAERLASTPRLVPVVEDQRQDMFGLCHEICGEDGLGWSLRVIAFADSEKAGYTVTDFLRKKYVEDYSLDRARRRVNEVIGLLTRRLESQAEAGNVYLVGDALSAADIYWAAFSILLCPMPHEVCHAPDQFRIIAENCALYLEKPLSQLLVDHRDRTLRDHYKLPITV